MRFRINSLDHKEKGFLVPSLCHVFFLFSFAFEEYFRVPFYSDLIDPFSLSIVFYILGVDFTEDLSPAFFPTASDMWTTHPALAYSAAAAAAAAAAAELQGQGPGAAAALQHAHAHHAAALAVHPALHPQLPVRFFHQLHALQHSQQQQQQQQQLP